MRSAVLLSALLTGAGTLAAAVPAAAETPSPGFLAVPLRRAVISASALRARRSLSLSRRAGIQGHHAAADPVDLPEVDLVDLTNAYLAEVALGSPTPQPLTLIVDTGSAWLWTNPSCEWARNQRLCLQFPRYDVALSSPAPKRVPELDGFQGYASGDWASLFGYADTLWLEGWKQPAGGAGGRKAVKVEGQAVGVANETDGSFLGFLGLGPDLLTGFDSKVANYSVLNNLVGMGAIASRTFAVGLEDELTYSARSESGCLLPFAPLRSKRVRL